MRLSTLAFPTENLIELDFVLVVEQLYERAHQYANLANRTGPIAKDLMLACEDKKLLPKDLYRAGLNHSRKRKRGTVFPRCSMALLCTHYNTDSMKFVEAPTLIPPPSRSPSPQMLPSDDEDALPVIPVTLRGLPSYFPDLPPKHTYLRTPVCLTTHLTTYLTS